MQIDVAFIFNIIIGVVTAYISWSMKELYANQKADKQQLQKEIDRNEKRTIEVEKDFDDHVKRMPEKYVLKEDFNREINKLDAKLDRVREDIGDLNKNVSSLVAIWKERGSNS